MQEDLRKRIRKLCQEVLILNAKNNHHRHHRHHNKSKNAQVRMTRTIRNVSVNVAPAPVISKHQVTVVSERAPVNAEPSVTEFTESSVTALDKILRRLRSNVRATHALLLVTPSSKHIHQYKLHVIDRQKKSHLGMTSITGHELMLLKTNQAFEQYCIILATKYIDLKTVALDTAIIMNLVNAADGNCCDSKSFNSSQSPRASSPAGDSNFTHFDDSFIETVEPKPTPDLELKEPLPVSKMAKEQEVQTVQNVQPVYVPIELKGAKQSRLPKYTSLATLIERINTTIEPHEDDLERFFDMAVKYNFRIYVRPELCWKLTPKLNDAYEGTKHRFNVECFMLFDSYVGGITMESNQLQHQLRLHPSLLSRLKIITDVCEITPLPKPIVALVRTLFSWLGMEIFYDAFGEYIFDIYKKYA